METLATLFPEVFHSDKDGNTRHCKIPVKLREDGMFIIDCNFIEHLGLAAEFSSLEELINHYEYKSEVYARNTLSKKGATPVLIAWLYLPVGVGASIGLNWQPALQRPDASLISLEGADIGPGAIRIPDTPQARAKLDALITSIKTAREILEGLSTANDPLAYLLAIDFNKPSAAAPEVDAQPAEPVQTELSLEPASDDNPAPSVDADDDEL